MVVVAAEPVQRRFVARPWSLAYCFHVACLIGLLIIPFIIAYTSNSLWTKEKFGRERPEVHFQHVALLIADDATSGASYMFSTSPTLNEVLGTSLRPMVLRVREEDADNDGRPEVLRAEVSVPVGQAEAITGFTAFIGLDYHLRDTVRWSTNATAIVQHTAGTPGSALDFLGDVELRQRDVLLPISAPTANPPRLLGLEGATSVDQLRVGAIAERYMAYPATVHVRPRYPLWQSALHTSTFTASIALHTSPQVIEFQPGIAEMLKFAWVQYIAFFLPLYYILRFIKWFAASNQITPCRVVVEGRQQKRLTDHDF